MHQRRLLAVALPLLLAVPAAARAQPGRDELRRLQKEAAAAHARKDYPAFLELSRTLQAKAPRSNRALYNLACAHALAGSKDEALRVLDRLASRGVAYDAAADADFAGIKHDPGFLAVIARTKALDQPVGTSSAAFTLPDKTLITEGVAHDPSSGAFFVSSVHRRKVVRVDRDGRVSDFTDAGDGLYSTIALAVDAPRGILWATSQASKRMAGHKDEKGSFVAELDLATGRLRRRIGPPEGVADAELSDIALGPQGELAVADPISGRVYLLAPGAQKLQVLIDRGPIDSAQGMAFSPDGRWLFVADYVQGIVKVDVAARTARRLELVPDAAVTGIDGLVWADGSLVGIQNGVNPHRVVRLRLDAGFERIEEVSVLERRNPHFDEPTLGVRVGSDLYYVANSQYGCLSENGAPKLDCLKPPVVLKLSLPWLAQTQYPLTPDSLPQAGVPTGTLTKHSWTSQVFAGTVRDYWVYVPAQYKPGTPAAVMVFQDGAAQVDEKGRWRANVVLDNLIHKGEMPVTIGIFVNPGVLEAKDAAAQQHRYNRSFEYDALGDRYARFLEEEILPEVGKSYALTQDPNLRGIGGSSSGAAAAFTAAWNRPDQFRRVLSFIGSYTGLRGADVYPTLVRKSEQKPLRIFLQDGSNDLNIYSGSWWIGNQQMASALEYAGYDVKFVTGDQAHNGIHGSAILPDALRWLWRDWAQPIAQPKGRVGAERHWISEILSPDHGWELVSEGHQLTEGPSVDRQGNVFFTDIRASRIYKVDHATRQVRLWKEDTGRANGMMVGPDGRLYACQNGNKKIVAYDPDGKETTIAEGVDSNDLAVNLKGEIYFSDPPGKRIWLIDAKGAKRVVHEGGIEYPNGVRLTPDQSKLVVADYRGRTVWLFEIAPNGDLHGGTPFYRLELADDDGPSLADGMTFDTEGHLYVTTRAGVQVCDQPGRVNAIIARPQPTGPLTNVVFAGPELDWLYVTAGDKVYRRKLRRTGVLPWKPVKPPQPRL